jgi:hypothetical protein
MAWVTICTANPRTIQRPARTDKGEKQIGRAQRASIVTGPEAFIALGFPTGKGGQKSLPPKTLIM